MSRRFLWTKDVSEKGARGKRSLRSLPVRLSETDTGKRGNRSTYPCHLSKPTSHTRSKRLFGVYGSMAKLYEQLAHLWPLLSPAEDYAADADRIGALIDAHLQRPNHDDDPDQLDDPARKLNVVEFGAGGGHTLFFLSQDCQCTAVDLSDAMLENSRHINPDVTHIVADMRNAQLDMQFDVVLIHDAIDYLTTESDIAATFATAAKHLRAGGLLIVAPTYVAETFVAGESMEDENADDDTEVRFISRVARVTDLNGDGEPNLMEMHLTIFIRDLATQELTVETDKHTCGLFAKQTWLDLMRDAGFDAKVDAFLQDEDGDDEPIPTFVGVKAG